MKKQTKKENVKLTLSELPLQWYDYQKKSLSTTLTDGDKKMYINGIDSNRFMNDFVNLVFENGSDKDYVVELEPKEYNGKMYYNYVGLIAC